MGIKEIDTLRNHVPGFFEDRDGTIPQDDYLRIPTYSPEPPTKLNKRTARDSEERELPQEAIDPGEEIEAQLAESDIEVEQPELDPNALEHFGGHPGGLLDDSRCKTRSTIVERLAFYLPFHSFPAWWGIYVFPEGLQRVRYEFQPFFRLHNVGGREQIKVAKRILYHHEFYHHATESFATRVEAALFARCYLDGVSPLYKRTHLKPECLEETCANSYAREHAAKWLTSVPLSDLRNAIDDWFMGQPPGYAQAAGSGRSWDKRLKPRFFEECMRECQPIGTRKVLSTTATKALWLIAGYFDRAIGDVRNRLCYLIPKRSPFYRRLPLDVRTCIKLDEFKRRLMRLSIGQKVREGKSHELWKPSRGGRLVPIPRHKGRDIPKGTMAKILKQFGEDKSIDDFLTANV